MKFGKLAATAVGSWVEDEEQEAIESMHLALAMVAEVGIWYVLVSRQGG